MSCFFQIYILTLWQTKLQNHAQIFTLFATCNDALWNIQYGYGLIDAYKALFATSRKQINY
jgi:hypothetical protein